MSSIELIELDYKVEKKVLHFKFVGTAVYGEQFQGTPKVEFYDLQLYEVVRGKEIPFIFKGYTWTGCEMNADYAIADILSKYMLKHSDVYVLHMDDTLKKYLEKVSAPRVLLKTLEIPVKIIYGMSLEVYQLLLVTDMYTYYAADDMFLMLETGSFSVVSDNYFAEIGWNESIENIATGKETEYFKSCDCLA